MNGATQKATIAKSQVFSNSIRSALMGNIVGEWKLDDGINTVASDTWGGLNNGALTNFDNTGAGSGDIPTNTDGWMTAANCISGGCLKFDGANDYVDCGTGTSLQITGVITLSAWMKSGYSGWNTVLEKDNYNNNGFWFGNNNGGTLYFYMFSGGTVRGQPSSTIVIDNIWHHIAAVYDGNKTIYYVDGANIYTKDWGSYLALGNDITTRLRISNSGSPFHGSIDEVRIYNAAIPTSQIKEQYYAGLNKLLANKGITREEYRERIGEMASY
jgi:hypothetical protein